MKLGDSTSLIWLAHYISLGVLNSKNDSNKAGCIVLTIYLRPIRDVFLFYLLFYLLDLVPFKRACVPPIKANQKSILLKFGSVTD